MPIPVGTATERRLLVVVAALAAFGTLASLLALAGRFRPVWLLALLALVAGVGFAAGRGWARAGSEEEGGPWRHAWPVLAVLPVALLLAFYPAAAFDDTLYHLPLARSLATHGSLVFEPQLRYPAFPMLQEVLVGTFFVLGGGTTAANLLSTAELGLLGAVVALWARRRSDASSAAVATALLLGSPLLVWLGSAAYVDLALALFVVTGLWAVELAATGPRQEQTGWLVLAGALTGAAAATKYHGLFFLAAMLAAAGKLAWRECRPRLLVAAGGGALLTAPIWYLRNLWLTGNPVHPFLAGTFGRDAWSATSAMTAGPVHGSPLEPSWAGWAAAAGWVWRVGWELFLAPIALLRESVAPTSVPAFSPLTSLVLPLVGWAALARRGDRALGALVLAYLGLWLAGVRDVRYLLPAAALAVVLLAPWLADAARWARAARIPGRRAVAGLLLVTCVAPAWLFGAWRVARRGWPPLSAAEREAYLDRWLPGHSLLARAAQVLESGGALYGLHCEQLQYYAPGGRLLGDWNGPYRFARVEPLLRDPAALAAQLREMGATLLLAPAEAVRGCGVSDLRRLARRQGFELWQVEPRPAGSAGAGLDPAPADER